VNVNVNVDDSVAFVIGWLLVDHEASAATVM
jgi:hypothetical protein